MSRPILIAHRGASSECPENTLAAFERALELGADWIELDLQPVSDGVVVFHDDELERLTSGRGKLIHSEISQLRKLRVTVPERRSTGDTYIPTLDEVLERIGTRCPLYLELKSDGKGLRSPHNARLLATVLERVPAASAHVVASFDAELVRAALEAKRKTVYIFAKQSALKQLSAPEIGQLFALSARYQLLADGIAEQARAARVPLWIWTVDAPADIAQSVEAGAAGICSNDVAAARRVLDSLTR